MQPFLGEMRLRLSHSGSVSPAKCLLFLSLACSFLFPMSCECCFLGVRTFVSRRLIFRLQGAILTDAPYQTAFMCNGRSLLTAHTSFPSTVWVLTLLMTLVFQTHDCSEALRAARGKQCSLAVGTSFLRHVACGCVW